ncbi:MAG: hypothetical protein ACXVJ1_08960 [Candidatus Angelobacter sp.]
MGILAAIGAKIFARQAGVTAVGTAAGTVKETVAGKPGWPKIIPLEQPYAIGMILVGLAPGGFATKEGGTLQSANRRNVSFLFSHNTD